MTDRTAPTGAPDAAPRSPADAYVADLAASGTAGTPGRFTVDARRVRELLRDFQLPDPAAYALLLVQAAVLRGARSLQVTSSRSRLTLTFDGAPFTRQELDARFDLLMAEPETDLAASMRRLGLGLQGLLAFNPRARATLRSGDGRTGVCLVIDPDHEDARAEDSAARSGTTLTLDRRAAAPPRDAELIDSRCRHASMDVTVNGQRVTAQPWEPQALRFPGSDPRLEVAAEPLGPPQPELRIVQHGVVIQVRSMPRWPYCVRIVARAEGLPTDLTGFSLRETPASRALLAACDAAVTELPDAQRRMDEILRLARAEAQRRLDRLQKLRMYPLIGAMPIGIVAVGALMFALGRDERAAFLFFPVVFAPIGLGFLGSFLWERLWVRPLARVLLPRGTNLHDQAQRIVSDWKAGAEARKVFDL